MNKYTFEDIWNTKDPKKPDDLTFNVSITRHKWKDKVCQKCGHEKMSFGYSRNGHVFVFSPECIDWEVENGKTID